MADRRQHRPGDGDGGAGYRFDSGSWSWINADQQDPEPLGRPPAPPSESRSRHAEPISPLPPPAREAPPSASPYVPSGASAPQPPRISRSARRRSRRGRRTAWVVVGALVLVAAGAAVVWRTAGGPAGAGSDCLRLVIPPELLVVERAGQQLDGGCVTVTAASQAAIGEGLARADRGDGEPDAWVVPSTAWARMALRPESMAVAPQEWESVARTPVVVAAPRKLVESLGWPRRQASWAEIAGGTIAGKIPRMSMRDPVRTSDGLLATLGVHAAMARTTADQGIAQMRALTLRSRLADADADPAQLLQRAGSQADQSAAIRDIGVFPATEQALWVYQSRKPAVPLVAGVSG